MVRQNIWCSIILWDFNFPFGQMSVHQVKQDSQESFRRDLEEEFWKSFRRNSLFSVSATQYLQQWNIFVNTDFFKIHIADKYCNKLIKHSLCKICEDTGFLLPAFSRMRTKSTTLSLYGKIQDRETRNLAYFMQCLNLWLNLKILIVVYTGLTKNYYQDYIQNPVKNLR